MAGVRCLSFWFVCFLQCLCSCMVPVSLLVFALPPMSSLSFYRVFFVGLRYHSIPQFILGVLTFCSSGRCRRVESCAADRARCGARSRCGGAGATTALPPPSVSLRKMNSLNPLPASYHFFFTTVEPSVTSPVPRFPLGELTLTLLRRCRLLTLGGVWYAVATPREYHQGLIPSSVVRPQPVGLIHPSSVMAIRQLGSCQLRTPTSLTLPTLALTPLASLSGFFLLALFASLLLRKMYSTLRHQPTLLEPLVATCTPADVSLAPRYPASRIR